MIRSMTGYGKHSCELNGKTITAEIKTLNSKQLDIVVKLPQKLKEKELLLRSMISQKLERGKIELYISLEQVTEQQNIVFNRMLARKYFDELKSFAVEISEPGSSLLPVIIRMPDVLKTTDEAIDEPEWSETEKAVSAALDAVTRSRNTEGVVLGNDFSMRIELIQKLLEAIIPFEKQRIESVRKRLNQALASQVDETRVDKDRFEQELIYYLEKLDITEEKVRLQKHCQYFISTMDESSSGKKLGFIAQEIGREINTIGSKANDVSIQKIVVQMKDELEKIKEQLLNIL